MRGQCCRLEVWEDLSYLCQLFLCEGSGELVFVSDMGSNVLLGTEFSCLVGCDELGVKLGPKDTFRLSKVVGIDSIRHKGSVSSGCCSERSDRVLAHRSHPYMRVEGGS